MERTSNPGLHEYIANQILVLSPSRESQIIDLGCGSGALLKRLSQQGYLNLVGVDMKPPVSTPQIRYEQTDLDSFDQKIFLQKFDISLAVEVIEHIENMGSFLDNLASLLKPGGLALFTTPNLHSTQNKIRFTLSDNLKQFDQKGDPTHIAPIFIYPFAKVLKRHGFIVKRSWSYPLDGSSPTSRPLFQLISRLSSVAMRNTVGNGDTLIILAEYQCRDNYDKSFEVTSHY